MSIDQRKVHQPFIRPISVFSFLMHAHDHLWLDREGFTLAERNEGGKILSHLMTEHRLSSSYGDTIDE